MRLEIKLATLLVGVMRSVLSRLYVIHPSHASGKLAYRGQRQHQHCPAAAAVVVVAGADDLGGGPGSRGAPK